MASWLVVLCLLLASAALADEGGGGVVWLRPKGKPKKLCCSVARNMCHSGGGPLPPHKALIPEGGVGAVTSRTVDEVTWWKEDERLPNVGAVLKVSEPGRYRCRVKMATGSVLGLNQTVALAELSKTFTTEPANSTVGRGNPVVLQCRIHSWPAANITWSRDDQLLTMGDRYIILGSGDLVIANATVEDEGSYRCSATNAYYKKALKQSRPATLTVEEQPTSDPRFLLEPPDDIQLLEGEELLLPCLITGDPSIKAYWSFGHKNGEVETLPGGALYRLLKAQARHGGVYTCSVRGHERLTKSTSVTVTRPARIIKAPESIHKPSAGTVRLDCAAEGDPTPAVVWYKNGEKLSLDGRVKVGRDPGVENRLQLVIGGVQPADKGVYQCFAQSGTSLPDTAWATLGVTGSALTPPRGLRCRPLSLDTVRVEWSPDRKTIGHSVHFVQSGCRDCKENTKPGSGPSADVKLAPGVLYEFYVREYTTKQASDPTDKVLCRGQGVKLKVSKEENSVTAHWSDAGDAYILQLRPIGTENITEVRLDGSQRSYLLPGVTPDSDLEVRLLLDAKEQQDLSLVPWKSVRDDDDASDDGKIRAQGPVVPHDLTVSPVSPTSLAATWRCDSCENSTTFVLCYKRSDLTAPVQVGSVCKRSDSTWTEVSNLEPDTTYEVRVQAFGGREPFSEALLVTTLRAKSTIDKVYGQHTERGVSVWWTLLADLPRGTESPVYTVKYSQRLSPDLSQWKVRNVTDTHTDLTDVQPELETYVTVSSWGEEHSTVLTVAPYTPSRPQYALLGAIAGAVVMAVCVVCCALLCVWRRRKRPQRHTDPSEMTTRTGQWNGDRRAGEPLLSNGYVRRVTAHINPRPNDRYPRTYDVFDVSRHDDANETAETVLELDATDIHHPAPDFERPAPDLEHPAPDVDHLAPNVDHLAPDARSPEITRSDNTAKSPSVIATSPSVIAMSPSVTARSPSVTARSPNVKLPDDNMNSESARFRNRAPTLQPNG